MPAHRANNVETKRRCEDTPRPWADARYPLRPRIRGVRMALGPLRMFVSTTVKSSLGFAFFSRLHVRTLGKLLWGDPTFFSTLSITKDPRVRHVVCSSVGECGAHGAHQGPAASRYPRGRQSSAFRQESSDYSVHCSGMLWFTMLCIASEA